MPSDEELGELVRRTLDGRGPFRPGARYDEGLRRVLVQIRDCSICEHEYRGVMTLLEDNYPDEYEKRWAGFAIYASRGFMIREGLAIAGRVNLYVLLDEVESRFPHLWEKVGICRHILEELGETSHETTVKLW